MIDWYRTFAALAGANASADASVAPAPLESLDLWPWLSGVDAASPRDEVVYDHRMNSTDPSWKTSTLPGFAMGALRVGRWKLIVGSTKQASWYGHFTPNSTACSADQVAVSTDYQYGSGEAGGKCPSIAFAECGDAPCLFDVLSDKTEHDNVASDYPEVLARLIAKWVELGEAYHPPPNPTLENTAYCAAIASNRGFVAPWKAIE